MSRFRFVSLLNLLEFCHLVYTFLIHNKMRATHFKPKEHHYMNLPITTNFCAYIISDIVFSVQFICFYFVFFCGFTHKTSVHLQATA